MLLEEEDTPAGYNRRVEEHRARDFPQLHGACYLDYAGAALYSAPQLQAVFEDLRGCLLSNPHSQSASSRETAERVEEARELVANYFGVCLEDYSVIFTAGCTASLQLVAHSLPLCFPPSSSCCSSAPHGTLLYPRDLHTSAVGVRDVFRERGAAVRCLDDAQLMPDAVVEALSGDPDENHRALCVLSAQCNFSGARLDTAVAQAVREALGVRGWLLLDAASLASCGEVDLEEWGLPDFVTLSFYKIFGYPTGLGALLVRNETASEVLKKNFFGGGSQDAYLPGTDFHRDRSSLTARMEDGTVSFTGIAALKFGFEALNAYSSEQHWIARHVFSLARFVRLKLDAMRHKNGAPVAALYPREASATWRQQGGVVTFNILRDDGSHVGFSQVARIAELSNIHLRVGCFCNLGACQRHLGLSDATILSHLSAGHVCGDSMSVIEGRPTGAVRVSFGYSSVLDDAHRLLHLIDECFRVADVPSNPALAAVPNDGLRPSLQRICIFPLKSCAPFTPRSWPLCSTGFLHDREFVITDRRGAALHLTKNLGFSSIKPTIDLERGCMTLSFEGHEDLVVDLAPLPVASEGQEAKKKCRGRVCNVEVKMADCGEVASRWVSSVLQREGCRLMRQAEQRTAAKGGDLSLNNQAQVLVINLATVRHLRNFLPGDVSEENLASRFRANFFIDHVTPLSEDNLTTFRVGDEVFKAMGPCARCRIICVDPEKDEVSDEPMRTIMKTKSELTFGVYFMRCDPRKSAEVSVDQPLVLTFKSDRK